ncbi:sigma-70 family RNA polymerase sigma factor [Pelagicoccus sp. SDUM812003]|uniref:RNA polymerase sigma factor n=1 Tax=Pelagicoccus sp. SDUM812003 TaxID=3041267 RepID=UPI002810562E|nr:sigma-70 family RNA polymerase sigma factor [Pelagicoccus sp. SDUM812003]MDQ8204261.1 sigma-70 family RNA polymerase sigma factor [Pelagicoccus sp. SDUM812003]
MKPGVSMDDASFEAELIRRIANRERDAFDQLYARYSRPLFSYIFKFLRDHGLAEEVLQDVFVKIWKTAHRYDPKLSRPFSWSVLVTKRLCIDRLRASKPVTVTDDPMAYKPAEEHRQDDRDPSDHVAVKDEIGILRSLLEKLPESQRLSLELSMDKGLTQQEISDELDMPLGTVKTAMRRGMQKLKTMMAANNE